MSNTKKKLDRSRFMKYSQPSMAERKMLQWFASLNQKMAIKEKEMNSKN